MEQNKPSKHRMSLKSMKWFQKVVKPSKVVEEKPVVIKAPAKKVKKIIIQTGSIFNVRTVPVYFYYIYTESLLINHTTQVEIWKTGRRTNCRTEAGDRHPHIKYLLT